MRPPKMHRRLLHNTRAPDANYAGRRTGAAIVSVAILANTDGARILADRKGWPYAMQMCAAGTA